MWSHWIRESERGKKIVAVIGIHFSYYTNIQNEQTLFKTLLRIAQILKLSRVKSLSLGGKITVFKSLAISKIVFLAKLIIDAFQKIKKRFLWGN